MHFGIKTLLFKFTVVSGNLTYFLEVIGHRLFNGNVCLFDRDRPAAIPVEVKSIDDTSNFDEFPNVDLKWRKYKRRDNKCKQLKDILNIFTRNVVHKKRYYWMAESSSLDARLPKQLYKWKTRLNCNNWYTNMKKFYFSQKDRMSLIHMTQIVLVLRMLLIML